LVGEDTHADELPAARRPWRVKFDGACSRCGAALPRGTAAVWERSIRTMHCVECPKGTDEPDDRSLDVGIAGASARREYERRMAKRDANNRNRYGNRLGGFVTAVTSEAQSTRAWATGARGEEALASALAGLDGVQVLHDRRVPGSPANIDHVVISPAGIFVVDAKAYKGQIQIRNRGWFFKPDYRLYVGRRDCSQLASDLGWQVKAIEIALGSANVDPIPPVNPVLCFVGGEWPLLSPPTEFLGVRLEGTRSIRKLVTADQRLDAQAIEQLTYLLATALPSK
jgi:hypothetical protein